MLFLLISPNGIYDDLISYLDGLLCSIITNAFIEMHVALKLLLAWHFHVYICLLYSQINKLKARKIVWQGLLTIPPRTVVTLNRVQKHANRSKLKKVLESSCLETELKESHYDLVIVHSLPFNIFIGYFIFNKRMYQVSCWFGSNMESRMWQGLPR